MTTLLKVEEAMGDFYHAIETSSELAEQEWSNPLRGCLGAVETAINDLHALRVVAIRRKRLERDKRVRVALRAAKMLRRRLKRVRADLLELVDALQDPRIDPDIPVVSCARAALFDGLRACRAL